MPAASTPSRRVPISGIGASPPSGIGADLRALAEHTRGVAVDCDNVIYLHGDTRDATRSWPWWTRRRASPRGGAGAQAAVRQVGDRLGLGVANLANIFNPEMVIFGGALREVHLTAVAQARSRLNRNGLPACREHVRLRTPALGDGALLGAAELAFERLLADPLDTASGT